jgi:hypothetical protein
VPANKIAVIKTGWCETYDGDLVGGAHANVTTFGEGHERYNFRPGADGRYYGYTPPIGKTEAAPSPKDRRGWLVFVVAKEPRRPGIYLVGWYEGAEFQGAYEPRPEYDARPHLLERDAHGGPFSYTLVAGAATLIPTPARTFSFRGDRMKRTSISYLRGNGEKGAWREELASSLLAARKRFSVAAAKVLATSVGDAGGGICGDKERRKEVEEAAVARVRAHFGDEFHFVDRQRDKCGFDLLFTHKESGEEHHVEVKGTAMLQPHFFMSANELAYARKWPQWQLAIVSDALGARELQLMNYQEAKAAFDWQVCTWHATLRKN